MANYKNDQDSIITAEEWQRFNHIIVLLEPFCFVTTECRKNNAFLSSVILQARSLTKIVNFYENSKEGSVKNRLKSKENLAKKGSREIK